MSSVLLEASGLEIKYGSSQALFGCGIAIEQGQIVALLGRNGMGKSTLVKAIMGKLPIHAGEIHVSGRNVTGLADYEIARMGLGLVPEGRGIFPNLTVYENLVATAAQRFIVSQPWTLDEVYALFPRLQERAANMGCNLSGGEQQMLAIGRALMTNPRLMILDEATEGLAPLVRAEIWRCLRKLKQAGMSMLLIDKNIGPQLELADCHYIMEKGRVVWAGSSAQLKANRNELKHYISV
ncbi:ABC transporter ATP-binding protein [Pusillimonas sp.]|uniref:ABC transporter ATP-binding protein n=1 Tax=Pusillimonas sp. TaxID=3040095 RepID=UPI0029B1085D|nr:ABC transporter ATP-binding protein [Pusillimonas sp.]MDX3895590.1 ABC transporter ATP-binding protein [Pusillimonas sp.]